MHILIQTQKRAARDVACNSSNKSRNFVLQITDGNVFNSQLESDSVHKVSLQSHGQAMPYWKHEEDVLHVSNPAFFLHTSPPLLQDSHPERPVFKSSWCGSFLQILALTPRLAPCWCALVLAVLSIRQPSIKGPITVASSSSNDLVVLPAVGRNNNNNRQPSASPSTLPSKSIWPLRGHVHKPRKTQVLLMFACFSLSIGHASYSAPHDKKNFAPQLQVPSGLSFHSLDLQFPLPLSVQGGHEEGKEGCGGETNGRQALLHATLQSPCNTCCCPSTTCVDAGRRKTPCTLHLASLC